MLILKENVTKDDAMGKLFNGDFQDTYVDSNVQNIEKLIQSKYGISFGNFSDEIFLNCYVGFYPITSEISSASYPDGETKNLPENELIRLSFDDICILTDSLCDLDEETNFDEIDDPQTIDSLKKIEDLQNILPDNIEIRIFVDIESILKFGK